MIKFELNKKHGELYVKVFNKFLFAFKVLKKQKKVDNKAKPEENKKKLQQDMIMAVMDTIPKDDRQYH